MTPPDAETPGDLLQMSVDNREKAHLLIPPSELRRDHDTLGYEDGVASSVDGAYLVEPKLVANPDFREFAWTGPSGRI